MAKVVAGGWAYMFTITTWEQTLSVLSWNQYSSYTNFYSKIQIEFSNTKRMIFNNKSPDWYMK